MSAAVESPLVDYSKTSADDKNLLGKLESSPSAAESSPSSASSSPSASPGSPNVPLTKLAATTTTQDSATPSATPVVAQTATTTTTSASGIKNKKKEKQHHVSLHQYDSRQMGGFYEACVSKLNEVYPSWNENWQLKDKPLTMSTKHLVYERLVKFAQESQEPMILLQNFDYGDISSFERFLQMLKQDGINSIGKYKQYLVSKDMKKLELDLVVVHAKYGILLIDIKECDYLDSKRRNKSKSDLNMARSNIENLVKLIVEAKGLNHQQSTTAPSTPAPTSAQAPTENGSATPAVPIVQSVPVPPVAAHQIPITEVVALPNVRERPQQTQTQQIQQQKLANSASPVNANLRQLNYLTKSDLDSHDSFKQWWSTNVVDKLQTRAITDLALLNHLIGMFSCIKNNSILPVVHKELDLMATLVQAPATPAPQTPAPVVQPAEPIVQSTTNESQPQQDQQSQPQQTNGTTVEATPAPAPTPVEKYKLSISGEFFHEKHEQVRSLSRVIVQSKDSDRIKRTVCMQILWILLNDSQKKISVISSEQNKLYYEEYFKLQRKLYNNLNNNVRFYSDIKSCPVSSDNTSHTLRRDAEIWFFDCDLNMISNLSKDVVDRLKELNAFWVFTQDETWSAKWKSELDTIANVNYANLDPEEVVVSEKDGASTKLLAHVDTQSKPWLSGLHLKFPLRLQSDLLIIGDIVTQNQVKFLLNYFKTGTTSSMSAQQLSQNGMYNHQQLNQQHSKVAKRLKSIKFIRGGSIDNLRTTIKMHDSIQAQVILLHVGDEDVFKTRNSQATIDRIKELTQLITEYCPKSFIVLSTLMRRVSKSENSVINEVNKGIIQYCKQARQSSNFFYMLNNHFDPQYHTYEGRLLSNKGLRLYVDNILFVVDYFLEKNNKQH